MLTRIFFALLFWATLFSPAPAQAALDSLVVKQLGSDDTEEKVTAIKALALSGDSAAIMVLQAMADDALMVAGDKLIRMDGERAFDALTGTEITPAPENATAVVVNNRIRGKLDVTLAVLKLFDADRATRLAAAKALDDNTDPAFIPILDRALAQERDPEVKKFIAQADALVSLKDSDPAKRLAAVTTLGDSDNPNLKSKLLALTDPANEPDEHVRIAAKS